MPMILTAPAEINTILQRRAGLEEAAALGWPILYRDGLNSDSSALEAIFLGDPAYELGTCALVYASEERPYYLDGPYWLGQRLAIPRGNHIQFGVCEFASLVPGVSVHDLVDTAAIALDKCRA